MSNLLINKRVLVTAGPTFERIDPVRFIGNFSTGKQGIEIAQVLQQHGCDVTLILGPTHLTVSPNIEVIRVESAAEMYEACMKIYASCDIIVMSAAVADFKPADTTDHKIKKDKGVNNIMLVNTVDILTEMGRRKTENQFLIGFALETNDALEYARTKLIKKNADMIVMNQPSDNTGFGHDTNQVTLVTKYKEYTSALISKKDVAELIAAHIVCMQK